MEMSDRKNIIRNLINCKRECCVSCLLFLFNGLWTYELCIKKKS